MMEVIEPEAFAHAALAMISELLEDNAPAAARWMPEDPEEAVLLFTQLRAAGLQVSALAEAALIRLRSRDANAEG